MGVATRDTIVDQLHRVRADLVAGRLPAGIPYRHVNGFTKIVAAVHPDGSRLTLHYWPADPGAPEDVSRPHDHRFPFESVLLGGRQHFVELAPGAAGELWRRYTYQPYLGGRFARVRCTGEARLEPVRVVERAPFDGRYSTDVVTVHQAVTDRASACATYVLRGPRARRTSQVYYRPAEPAPRGGLQVGRRLDRTEVLRQVDDMIAMADPH